MSEPRRTPLAAEHERLGARMVEFCGWWMPIQYKGLTEEHLNCRENIGLFDVSHMGEVRVKGENSLKTVEWVTTNNASRLESGEAQYSLLPNDRGGLVDDIIVYCIEKGKDYLICVNAANAEKDWNWIQKNNQGAHLINESNDWAQIAIQGPKAPKLMDEVFGIPVSKIKSFGLTQATYKGTNCIIARTGYTGEIGGEVFVKPEVAAALWRDLLDKGAKYGIQPVGLGARDTLRTEMKYPLYGHEINETSNPYSAQLGWCTKPSHKDFVGRNVILANQEKGLTHKLIGFKMIDKGIPRPEYKLFSAENKEIGYVTSGTHSPSLGEPIGIGYVENKYSELNSEFFVEIRNRKVKVKVCKTPFVVPKGE